MDNNVKKTKGSAYSQPDHIKPKSKWTKKTTVWVIVCAVIVLGILAIIGGNNGWFKTQDMINGKLILDDYSSLEINTSDVDVDEASVDYYMDNIVSSMTTYEDVTEGTVEDGDNVNLDYTGVLEGEEEPFEGGTATGTSLVLGSGSMIDGFEDQIVGHKLGETFDITVTFPEDYQNADLQNKKATFTITLNSKRVANAPELTDELVKEYSEANLDETIDNIEDMRTYYHDSLYNTRMETAIWNVMDQKAEVKYYNEADLAMMTNYNLNALSYYASSYGMDAATWASMYGYDNAEAYAEGESKTLLKQTMIADKVAEDQGIIVTDEELDEVLTQHMETEGFTGTLDEFKAQSGDSYLFLVKETELLIPKVTEYLKGNVTLIETPEEETKSSEEASEEAASEEPAEEGSEAADEAAEEVTEVAEEATEAVTEAVSEAAEEVVEEVSEAADEAVETVSEAVDEATEELTAAPEN